MMFASAPDGRALLIFPAFLHGESAPAFLIQRESCVPDPKALE